MAEYIVLAKRGIDISTYDKDGARVERHAKEGEKVELSAERAKSLINLVALVEKPKAKTGKVEGAK